MQLDDAHYRSLKEEQEDCSRVEFSPTKLHGFDQPAVSNRWRNESLRALRKELPFPRIQHAIDTRAQLAELSKH